MEIRADYDFSLRATALSHGWVNLAPFEWHEHGQVLTWQTAVTDSGNLAYVSVKQVEKRTLKVEVHGEVEVDRTGIESKLRRVLMLDWIPDDFVRLARAKNPKFANLVSRGAGRLLRGETCFEDAVKTVCTTNTSWNNTVKMIREI